MRDERQPRRVANLETRHILRSLHQQNAATQCAVELPHRAFYLGVARMTDEHHFAGFARIAGHLHVDLGHQRTRGIEHGQSTPLRFLLHGTAHSMRTEDDRGAIGHFIEFLDEQGPERPQPLHYVLVVDHLVAHVDGRTKQGDSAFYDVDGTVDTSAEATRIGEQQFHGLRRPSSRASRINRPAPVVMAISATLNAGNQ